MMEDSWKQQTTYWINANKSEQYESITMGH
jgi:hypothetical protein